jgi:hypothetical protein
MSNQLDGHGLDMAICRRLVCLTETDLHCSVLHCMIEVRNSLS